MILLVVALVASANAAVIAIGLLVAIVLVGRESNERPGYIALRRRR